MSLTDHRWSDPSARAADIASLTRTPIIIREIYIDRPDALLDSRHTPDTLSPREVLGHLIEAEKENWIPRIRHILQSNEPSPFPPFDPYGGNAISYEQSVGELVDEFARLRTISLQQLEQLQITEADLDKQAIHPKFGLVNLGQLLATWVVHDLYHLGQIFKSFAAPLQPAIGPWQEFLNLPNFN